MISPVYCSEPSFEAPNDRNVDWLLQNLYECCDQTYRDILDWGLPIETARLVLPLGSVIEARVPDGAG
ncbi:hypothetical protein D3C83_269450 [compost metagenome]